ncbi:hypothetical protein BDV32DRAFT_161906 [Aspergillus pseudonomiae]|uniref:Uncharacterized protein n=1 Tax=Aspergillus pseudonomiae TaxID=1506151 RepID=A0A5N7DK61_9EURO|nr:uncharacterized protein BDV37DRAFT_52441 [Aspergillus pseudonomiae]KAB8255450.1 hypothetical protein BDV32DRAFT_161906 [Aspergillus pseudonomiae]KAE8406734.1 hypothetical protein BDV37DRAFT_52441 [Aspergillus pseudonomiae]
MPPQTLTSPPIPSPNALDQHVLRTIFTQLKTVTSTTGFNAILETYDENNKLLDQLKSKGHELASLREEMDEERKRKDIALDEMFQANEKEKGRHKETKKHAQTLQTMINDKDTCISERDKVIDEFGKQVKKLQSDIAMERDKLAVARKEISGLQQSIQEKEATIDKMKAAGTELKDRLNSTKKTVKELQDERTSLRESLTKTEGNLKRLEGYAAGYSEMTEDSVIESFTGLWEYAKMEIFAMLKNDLPRDTLRNVSAWEKLRQCDLAQDSQVPIPCSNTPAAKQMRFAIILAILAREINTHILLPVYIAAGDNKYNQFRKVLANQAAIDSEKESFCRSVLLSIDPGTQEGICLVGIQAVVKNVSEYLDELLPEDQRLAFHNTLRKVVRKAADIWKPIQHSKRRYEPDFDPPTAEDDCEAFKFPITENVTTENNANQKNMKKVSLTVFPRLSIIEHGISTAYTAIIQVSSSQRQWVAAESEMDKEPASPTTIGRIPWRRKSNTPKTTSVPNGGSKKGNG